jgi:hypothetical protein
VVVRLGCDSDRMTVAPRYAENEEGDFDNRLCSDVYPMQPQGGRGRLHIPFCHDIIYSRTYLLTIDPSTLYMPYLANPHIFTPC